MNLNVNRLVNVSFAGLGIVVFLFIRQIAEVVWHLSRLPVPTEWPVTPADLIAFAAGVAVFVVLKKNNKTSTFTSEVIVELSKVTYPPRKETLLSGVVVSIMVAVCAMILFGFDTLWGTMVKLLYQ
jgi:preprotein translocase SecE subunit